MSVTKTNYGAFHEAWQVRSGDLTLTAVTEVGPRLMSLTRAQGPNLLFQDEGDQFTEGDWKIRGGHRFWFAPESPTTYLPDNEPCAAEIDDSALVITAPVPKQTMLEKQVRIEPVQGGFVVIHRARNVGMFCSQPIGLWALTCVRPMGMLAVPWVSGHDKWRTASIKAWLNIGGRPMDITDAQWKATGDLYELHPSGAEGKVGTLTERPWAAQWTEEATFVIEGGFVRDARYPHGCNIEMYSNERFCELETLTPLTTLQPDEMIEHVERWHVSAPIERSSAAVEALIARNRD